MFILVLVGNLIFLILIYPYVLRNAMCHYFLMVQYVVYLLLIFLGFTCIQLSGFQMNHLLQTITNTHEAAVVVSSPGTKLNNT